jgi:trigger factor
MQVTETLSDGLKRSFAITVPEAAIEQKRAAKLSEISKTVRLPGFRPGKVPASIVKQRYGTAVMAEVLEESVNDAAQQVLEERGLRPAGQPKIDVKQMPEAAGQDLLFDLEVELLPEIAMPDFAALELVRYKAEPAADVIDKALGEIASRQEAREPVTEDRGAQVGDTLTVDFLGKVGDVAFPGGTGTDMAVKLGGSGFIPGFSEGMEGMKPGEERTIHVTFPEEYHAKDLAGKAATFDLVAKTLEQPKPSVLDDALATAIGFESLDDLRQAVVQQIQREYDSVSRMRIKRDLLDALTKTVDFPAPPSMVEQEFGQIWQRVEADMKADRLDDEDKGKDEATLKSEYRAIAERRVRLGLLLSEIGRANGIQVQPDELTRAMRAEAGRYPGQEGAVMEFFRKNPQAADGLRGPTYEDKVIDFILELAKIEEQVVSAEELSADPKAPVGAAPGDAGAGDAAPAATETAAS